VDMMPRKIPSNTSEAKKCYKQAAPGDVSALGSSIAGPGIQRPRAEFKQKASRWVGFREPPAYRRLPVTFHRRAKIASY
jgi:hypothetical protein